MKIKIGYELAVSNPTLKDGWNADKYTMDDGGNFWLCYDEKALHKLFQEILERGSGKQAIEAADKFDEKILKSISDRKATGEIEFDLEEYSA